MGYFANAQYDVKAQGYFAYAQYDVLFFHVILNGVKDPTEELTGIYFITLVVGYFACARYDDIFFTLSVIFLLIVKNIFTKFYKIIYKNDKIY